MDAFTVVAELIPGVQLSAGQLAQLRAINHKYNSRLFALTRSPGSSAPPAAANTVTPTRDPTAAETSELRAMLVADVRALLTSDQLRSIEGA